MHIPTATSGFVLAIMTLTETLVHIWTGDLSEGVNRPWPSPWVYYWEAPLGANLSNRIRGVWILRSLAVTLILAGIHILIMFF